MRARQSIRHTARRATHQLVTLVAFCGVLLLNPALFLGCGTCVGVDTEEILSESFAGATKIKSWTFTTNDGGAAALSLDLKRADGQGRLSRPATACRTGGLVASAFACDVDSTVSMSGTMTLRYTPEGGAEEVLLQDAPVKAEGSGSYVYGQFSGGWFELRANDEGALRVRLFSGEKLGDAMRTVERGQLETQ